MARPSVKAERTEEILEAFTRCVARFGVEGTSLERIAEESGLRRSLLRYYVGNRDVLVEALADRFVARSDKWLDELMASLSEARAGEALLNVLFVPFESDDPTVLVADGLISASANYPGVQQKMRDWYDQFVDRIALVLEKQFPLAGKERCWPIAVGIISIFFNADAMEPLAVHEGYREASIESAKVLLKSLAV